MRLVAQAYSNDGLRSELESTTLLEPEQLGPWLVEYLREHPMWSVHVYRAIETLDVTVSLVD